MDTENTKSERQSKQKDRQTGRLIDRCTDMTRATRLVILIKNVYTLKGRKRFLPHLTHCPTNLVHFYSMSNGYKK